MLIVYRFLINLIFIFSPIIFILRFLKKKEDPIRFKEKIGFFDQKKKEGKLIWFHGASVGELQSIVPLIEKLEKNKSIKQILVTSNTLSSSKILKINKFNKVIHQFFPIDSNFLIKKFLNYWKPSKALFIDSEFWPNTIIQLKRKKIPIILINGRITKKTFQRWNKLSNFSKKIFSKFDLCFSSSKESLRYLKRLNFKNIKFIGNLKYSQAELENLDIEKNLKKFLSNKKTWCASSTHYPEELFVAQAHKILKKKIKNLITIIIPRHAERYSTIKNDLEKLNLKVHLDKPTKKISFNTDIYLVNSYGKTKSFYKNCNNIFLGGSLIKHGGQNPLEAARYGCSIINGPNVNNFKEIYEFLKKNNISTSIKKNKELANRLNILFSKQNNSKMIQNKIKTLGDKILKKTYDEIFIR
ncbi:3-deoxy-D-manno-octulosonic acid transferase [Pelagibacterales bacterium SAG-MED43]|nr:3-deoxy-D-manno-octulosonic acid transferase [Pelagibacterales bacterium SAG-MED43]